MTDVPIEELSSASRRMKLVLPDTDVTREIDRRIRKLTKTASLPGFRKGKVPYKVLEKRFGSDVRSEAITELMNELVQSVLVEKQIFPIRRPFVENYSVNDDTSDHEFTVGFEVVPEISETRIEGMKIVRPVLNLSEQDFDSEIESWTKEFHAWDPVDRPAIESDRVRATVDMQHQEASEADTSENAYIRLDDERYPESIRLSCLGLKAGDQTVAVVEDESAKEQEDSESESETEVASIEYLINILAVEEPVPDQLDRIFLSMLGIESVEDDKFRERARQKLERDCKNELRIGLRYQVLKQLSDSNEFDPPESVVAETLHRRMKDAGLDENVIMNLFTNEANSEFMLQERFGARQNIKLRMIISKAMEEHQIRRNVEEVEAFLRDEASYYPDPENAYQTMIQSKNSDAVDDAYLQMLVDRLLEDAECEDTPMGLDEFREWYSQIAMQETLEPVSESIQSEPEQEHSVILDESGNPIVRSA